MAASQPPYITISEKVVALGHPTLPDVANRALKWIMTKAGMNVDTYGYFGFRFAVNVKAYGAVGDNVADDTAAIQAAVDDAIYTGIAGVVWAPPGRYKTSDTIHLGYGDSFRSVIFEGEGFKFGSSSQFSGTAIIPTKYDRPAINIQGGRGTRVRSLSLAGALESYITTNNLGAYGGANAGYDDTLAATWDAPALGGAALDSRYRPFAGITIDAYSGAQPAAAYPAVTYPAFLGTVAQYNKNYSSDTCIEDCEIRGFTVPIAVQPGDSDGNGDFVNVRNCQIVYCKYVMSVGNAQSRNVGLYDLKVSQVHTAFVNTKHGRQVGVFGGPISNCSFGTCIQIVDIAGSLSSGMTFIQCYGEALWRIGNIGATATQAYSHIFEGCKLDFSGQNDVRGHPANICGSSETTIGNATDLRYVGCTFSGAKSVYPLVHTGSVFDGCYFNALDARTQSYQRFAHNALTGGLVTGNLHAPTRANLRSSYFNLDTGALASVAMTGRWAISSRPFCIPQYHETVVASNESDDITLGRAPSRTFAVAKSAMTGVRLVNGVFTFTLASLPDGEALQRGPLPGDVLWDDQTGSTFFVHSRVTTTIIAELQNNYRVVTGAKTPIAAFSTSVGNIYVLNSRRYTPSSYLRADLSSISTTAANAGRDDDYGTFIPTDIAVGDAVLVRDTQDLFISYANSVITSRAGTGTTGSIVFTGTPNRNQTRRRLDFFCRTGPANV